MQLGFPYPKRKEQLLRLYSTTSNRTHDLRFQGALRTFPIHTIPIGLPKYRLNNGRTLAAQAEYLATHADVPKDFFSKDLEIEDAQKIQHGLLRAMAEELLDYFKKHKQDEPLILSHEGFVVNGNRRLSAMRALLESDKKTHAHFEHIDVTILPPADEKDIDSLEAQLQIHRDIKADYSWTAQAFMLKKRKDEHKYSDDDLARLYDMKTTEVNEFIEMLDYANQYLQSRGKEGQYHLIEETKYAFQQLRKMRSSKTLKTEAERNVFEQVAYCLIDKPEDGRLYESIPAAGKHLSRIIESVRAEYKVKANPNPGGGHELLGGEGQVLHDVVEIVEQPANLEKVRAIVSEVVTSETAKERERKRGDFVLVQIKRANTALIEAINGITDNTERSGSNSQLDAIEKSLKILRKWVDGNPKN